MKKNKAQSLIEILLGLGIGVSMILGVSALMSINFKNSSATKMIQNSSYLADELAEKVKLTAEYDWHIIYCPPNGICPGPGKGSGNNYYINYSSQTPQIVAGTEMVTSDGKQYIRYFNINNTYRNQCGIGDITQNSETACSGGPESPGVSEDPSTQKISVIIMQGTSQIIKRDYYITRSRNSAFRQTDWYGGSGQEGPIVGPNNKYSSSTGVSTSTPGIIKIQGL